MTTIEKKSTGTIVSIQLCPGYRKPMKPVDSAELIENIGLKDDVHAIRDSSRQVLLLEMETLEEMGLEAGLVKENITTAGIRLMGLPRGTRLMIGGDAVLEITKPCSPCSRMDEIRPGLLKDIAGRRGVLARVITGGGIRKTDSITVLEG